MFRDRNPGQTPSPLQPAQRETKKAKFSGGKGPVAQWLERQSAGKNRSGLTQTWPGSWEPEAGTGVPPGGCYPSPSWSLRVEAVLSGLWPWPLKHWGSNLSVELFLCLRLPCLVKGRHISGWGSVPLSFGGAVLFRLVSQCDTNPFWPTFFLLDAVPMPDVAFHRFVIYAYIL
jgi:hypothetical protein